MSDEVKKQLLQSFEAAMDRVLTRLLGLSAGYTLILRAENIALKGNSTLKKDFDELDEKLKPAGMGSSQYFLSILFLDVICEMEIYLSSLVQAVVIEHPKKLGSASFKLSEIIDAESTHELVARASDELINKLMYKKPMEYLDTICDLLSIEKESLVDEWPNYVEAKARRDLGIHNRWICNSTYLRKLNEANIQTTAKEEDLMIPDYGKYISELLDHLGNLVFEIDKQLNIKYA